ncbi:MAG TPA: hypothetical protein VGO42_17650, partial [Reyranella sp.]|nr:hypothetical protein [Reyranella sp.]
MLVARAARESQQRLAASLGHAARDGQGPDPLQRLATVPMPSQPPFVEAAARYLAAHPGEDRALDAWPPQLAQERTEVRAAAAELPPPPAREPADAGIEEPAAGMEDQEAGEANWTEHHLSHFSILNLNSDCGARLRLAYWVAQVCNADAPDHRRVAKDDCVPARRSKSRTPEPRRTAAMSTWISSRRPAFRHCWIVSAPWTPPDFPAAAILEVGDVAVERHGH